MTPDGMMECWPPARLRPVGTTPRRVEPTGRREGWSLQIGHQWNNGMVERWNNGDKSGVKSDFILTAVLQILNRYHSTKPNIFTP